MTEAAVCRYISEADNLEGDMFRIIDQDGDGLIGEADLQSFMVLAAPCAAHLHGNCVQDSNAEMAKEVDFVDMLREASQRDDGKLTKEDFAEYMRALQKDDGEKKKRRVTELDAATRRALLIARLQGKLTRAIEDDPRFIKQKLRKKIEYSYAE